MIKLEKKKLSFKAINEGTRLKLSLILHEELFEEKATKVGGNIGYAGTERGDFSRDNDIQISFMKRDVLL